MLLTYHFVPKVNKNN